MRKLLLGLCVLVGVPWASHAGPITVTTSFQGVFVGYVSPVGSSELPAQLGSVTMSDGSNISPAIDAITFEAYCVDILGPFFDFSTQPTGIVDATAASMSDWDVFSGAQASAGNYAAWLYNEFAAPIAASDDDLGRTALQMAIWNVLYDSDFSVNTGAFQVDPEHGAVRTAANGYLDLLSGNLTAAALSDATWLQLRECAQPGCADVQDFIGPGLAQPNPVPEPATLSLFAIGVAAAGVRRLRRS